MPNFLVGLFLIIFARIVRCSQLFRIQRRHYFSKKCHNFVKKLTIFDPSNQFYFYALIFIRYQIMWIQLLFDGFFNMYSIKKRNYVILVQIQKLCHTPTNWHSKYYVLCFFYRMTFFKKVYKLLSLVLTNVFIWRN